MHFFLRLWNHPEVMHQILINSDPQIIQENLAPFLVNHFYFNHTSKNYFENNILLLLC